jgi:hypothetical protein
MRIGIISDTHGLLRPAAIKQLASGRSHYPRRGHRRSGGDRKTEKVKIAVGGKSLLEAYETAGFKPDFRNAKRLRPNLRRQQHVTRIAQQQQVIVQRHLGCLVQAGPHCRSPGQANCRPVARALETRRAEARRLTGVFTERLPFNRS